MTATASRLAVGAPPAVRALAFRSAAVLLGYPDESLVERLPLLRAVADRLPPVPAEHLRRFLDHAEARGPEELSSEYVDTFDLHRRTCLYLTYYSHGDTRKRGMALLRFTHAYRQAGAELATEELPDHLAVVCEFAAAFPGPGVELLREHRAGIELLRLALSEAGSAYLAVIELIGSVLPEPGVADRRRALELARSGPPAEEVGLEPFAPPESLESRR